MQSQQMLGLQWERAHKMLWRDEGEQGGTKKGIAQAEKTKKYRQAGLGWIHLGQKWSKTDVKGVGRDSEQTFTK